MPPTTPLAAWESATMANLGHALSPAEHDAVWAALVAFRDTQDRVALTIALRAATTDATPDARTLIGRTIDSLLTLTLPTE